MTKLLLLTLGLLVALAAPLAAQTPALPTSVLGWDQGGATLADVNTLVTRIYVDNAQGVAVTGRTCAGTVSPFQCRAPLPALTPGLHAIRLTSAVDAFESPLSVALDITMIVLVTPTNLQILTVPPVK